PPGAMSARMGLLLTEGDGDDARPRALGAGGPVAGVQQAQGLGQVVAEDLAAEPGEQRGQQAALGGAGQPADGRLNVAATVPVRADPVLPGTAWPERVGVDDFQPDRLGAGPVVAGALPDAAGEGGALGDLGPGVASGVHLVPAPVEVGPVVGAAVGEVGQGGADALGRDRGVGADVHGGHGWHLLGARTNLMVSGS